MKLDGSLKNVQILRNAARKWGKGKMELILEDGKRMYIDESIEGAIARLYSEGGILIEQKEFSAEFLCDALFGGAE